MEERDQFVRTRWVACQNLSFDTIPPFGIVEYSGVDVDAEGNSVVGVTTVSEDGSPKTGFNGPKEIIPNEYGQCTFETPAMGLFSGQAIPGTVYGPVAGLNSLVGQRSGSGGYIMIGDGDGDAALFTAQRNDSRAVLGVKLAGRALGTQVAQSLNYTGTFAGNNYAGIFEAANNGINVLKQGRYYVSLTAVFTPVNANQQPPGPVGFWNGGIIGFTTSGIDIGDLLATTLDGNEEHVWGPGSVHQELLRTFGNVGPSNPFEIKVSVLSGQAGAFAQGGPECTVEASLVVRN